MNNRCHRALKSNNFYFKIFIKSESVFVEVEIGDLF